MAGAFDGNAYDEVAFDTGGNVLPPTPPALGGGGGQVQPRVRIISDDEAIILAAYIEFYGMKLKEIQHG